MSSDQAERIGAVVKSVIPLLSLIHPDELEECMKLMQNGFNTFEATGHLFHAPFTYQDKVEYNRAIIKRLEALQHLLQVLTETNPAIEKGGGHNG